MVKQTDEWKIFPFYKTLSPIGATALPPPMKTKEKVEQGKGTAYHSLWVTDSIRIAHWSGMPNSLLNILPHHFHLKLSLLQEVFSIKNRFLTDWISFYGHSTTICIKGEILSSFIQDKISPLIFSWKVSLNIFSFKNRFWIDWISFYGHRTTICIKGEILSLCSNRLIQYFWPRVQWLCFIQELCCILNLTVCLPIRPSISLSICPP